MMIIKRDDKKKTVQREEMFNEDDLVDHKVECVISFDSHHRITITWVDEDHRKETSLVLNMTESYHVIDFFTREIRLR